MAFQPKQITEEHILQAVARIEASNTDLIPSTRWLIEIEGKEYPPKAVMRYAHNEMNGEMIWEITGGEPTNKYLTKYGFKLIDMKTNPQSELIRKYKKYIEKVGFDEELYKWELLGKYKGRPNVDAPDFRAELKEVNFKNLIYHNALSVMAHISKDRMEPFRACFSELFKEEKPLDDRIKTFTSKTLEIYRELHSNEMHSHHQDERTMSTYLTYYNPDKYTFYKSSFYTKYCALLGIKAKKKNEKYVHYLELVEDLIENYIKHDEELIQTFRSALPSDAYQDPNYKILAQDILYRSLDKELSVERKYWRIGTSDGKSSYWEFMKSNNKIAIGWPLIGDLNEQDVSSKAEVIPLLEGSYKLDRRTTTRKSGEIFNFYNEIKVGDVVLAQDGSTVLGIGEVEDEYLYVNTDEFAHQIPVTWKVTPNSFKNKKGLQTTVFPLTDKSLIKKIESLLENPINKPEENDVTPKWPLNQILFGPPGTGKTFNTINKALSIVENKSEEALAKEPRKNIKARYDQYLKNGQIVFTTFHQSMSYEEFIEGIRPETLDGKLVYEVKNGIFKNICQAAQTPDQMGFNEAYTKLIKELSNVDMLELKTPTGKPYFISLNSNDNLTIHTGSDNKKRGSMTRENIQAQINGENRFLGWEGYFQGLVSHLESTYQYSSKNTSKTKRYVLIIDEINRGNVSAIFGELITLIEEDKRKGKEETLALELPYSKTKFSVPNNVYIIGTMNTADRSVEALDTALRRRFHFIEMPPKSAVIPAHGKLEEGKLTIDNYTINLQSLLDTINERIEILLDRDHLIGHSYFMKVNDEASLKGAFGNKIIPLLQEYFYGDYGKISLVLGEGFCKGQKANIDKFATTTNGYDAGAFDEKNLYTIMNIEADDFDIVSAIKILNKEQA
jgi:5-methylcytosine-specific restriction protein B